MGKGRYMLIIEDYFNVERIFAPFLLVLSIILIWLSFKEPILRADMLVYGIAGALVALIMFIEGIVKKSPIMFKIGLTPAVYVIFGIFIVFESVRRLTQNFTNFSLEKIDFVLFLLVLSIGIHFLHIAGLMKYEDEIKG